MKIEMTQKDKNLLIMLSVFVIVVCIGYWGIYPVFKDMNEINEEISQQEDRKETNELKLTQVPMLEGDNESLQGEIKSARDKFYPMMTSAEVDEHFTDLVLSYNLASYDLTITMPQEETSLEPYQYSERAMQLAYEEEYAEAVETDSSESGNSEEAEIDAAEAAQDTGENGMDGMDEEGNMGMTGIYTVGVTMRLGGEEEDLQRLIEDLSNTDKKLRVCNYAWSEEKSIENMTEEGDYDIAVSRVLTISFEIYMCQEDVNETAVETEGDNFYDMEEDSVMGQ